MAIIRPTNAIQGISGRSGNAVYRFTRNGTEFASRPFVNDPNTPAQSAVRSSFSKVAKQWRTLPAADAAAWNEYAADQVEFDRMSGNRTSRSGFNWFVAFGTRYLTVNPSKTDAPTKPPTADYNGDAITVSAVAIAGGIKFSASAPNGSKSTTALLVQKLRNANAKPGKQFRTKTHFQFASGSLQTTVALAPGTYAVGYQFVNTDSGQESPFVSLGVVGPVTFTVSQNHPNKKAA
jgi:hypothetical protein